jgi:hypothetical protein
LDDVLLAAAAPAPEFLLLVPLAVFLEGDDLRVAIY